MSRSRLLLILGAAVPALLCAAVGLTHPMDLNPGTALYWQNMHIVLIPLFPLIALGPWLIARRVDRRLGWLAAFFGYGFATLYTALDILAGVGAGAMVLGDQADATGPIFDIARTLARVGVWSLVIAALVASVAAVMRARLAALPGAVLAIAGAYLVYQGHVYFPIGTLAMLLFAAGMAILAVAVSPVPKASAPSGGAAGPSNAANPSSAANPSGAASA